jgi:hypothetical protein
MSEILIKLWKSIPYKIQYKLDIIRRFPVWKKHNVIFIHIPKAAGVSVNNAIYGRSLGHFYAKDIKSIYPKDFKDIYTFSVVRHPIERLYSAYCFAHKGGTNIMGMHNKDYYINNPYFESFESFVRNWLVEQDLNKIDGVFRPQYLYLFDKKNQLLVNNFYKLEDIEDNFNEISKKLGRSFSLGHHNKSEKEKLNISNDLRELIYRLYQKDFELLGYLKKEN